MAAKESFGSLSGEYQMVSWCPLLLVPVQRSDRTFESFRIHLEKKLF